MPDIKKQIAMVFRHHGVRCKDIKNLIHDHDMQSYDSNTESFARYNMSPVARYAITVKAAQEPVQHIQKWCHFLPSVKIPKLPHHKHDTGIVEIDNREKCVSIMEQYLRDQEDYCSGTLWDHDFWD